MSLSQFGSSSQGHSALGSAFAPEKELQQIYLAFLNDPLNEQYRFRELFYNKADDPSQRVKPQGVDETRWR